MTLYKIIKGLILNLKDFYFFSFLSDDELKELEKITILKSYSKNQILFYSGDKPKYLYILLKGMVKLYKHDFKGHEMVIHNISAPSFIAEIANYEEMPFPANCTFEIDSEVALIDYEEFKNRFLYKKDIAMLFIKSLTNKIKYLENFIYTNMEIDISAKVAKFIYENEATINNMKQVKIAEILNIREETLSRKIAKLIKDKIIKKEKRELTILDHQKLLEQFS